MLPLVETAWTAKHKAWIGSRNVLSWMVGVILVTLAPAETPRLLGDEAADGSAPCLLRARWQKPSAWFVCRKLNPCSFLEERDVVIMFAREKAVEHLYCLESSSVGWEWRLPSWVAIPLYVLLRARLTTRLPKLHHETVRIVLCDEAGIIGRKLVANEPLAVRMFYRALPEAGSNTSEQEYSSGKGKVIARLYNISF
jgi:hypothetical protein